MHCYTLDILFKLFIGILDHNFLDIGQNLDTPTYHSNGSRQNSRIKVPSLLFARLLSASPFTPSTLLADLPLQHSFQGIHFIAELPQSKVWPFAFCLWNMCLGTQGPPSAS